MPEAMVFGPLPGIGLVSALHSLSTFETSGSTRPERPGSRATGIWGDGWCIPHHRGFTAYARRPHVRRERGISTTQAGIRPASAGPTKITVPPLAATRTSVYRSSAGHPPGGEVIRAEIGGPPGPGPPVLVARVAPTGIRGCNPHLVDCLVDYSRYEGPMSR